MEQEQVEPCDMSGIIQRWYQNIIINILDFVTLVYTGVVGLWVMGIHGDLFSPGSFMINPRLD